MHFTHKKSMTTTYEQEQDVLPTCEIGLSLDEREAVSAHAGGRTVTVVCPPSRPTRRKVPTGPSPHMRIHNGSLKRDPLGLKPVKRPGTMAFSSVASVFDFHHHVGTDPAHELLVLKCILSRECVLSQLEEACREIRERCQKPVAMDGVIEPLGDRVALVIDMLSRIRDITVAVTDAILSWRKGVNGHPPLAFIWHGENYLLKAINDLNFLAGVKPLVTALKMHPARLCRNPLMLPHTLDEQRRNNTLCRADDDSSPRQRKRRNLYRIAQVMLDEETIEIEREANGRQEWTSSDSEITQIADPHLDPRSRPSREQPPRFIVDLDSDTRYRSEGLGRAPVPQGKSTSSMPDCLTMCQVEEQAAVNQKVQLSTWYEEARLQLVSLSASPEDQEYFLSSRRFWSKEELGTKSQPVQPPRRPQLLKHVPPVHVGVSPSKSSSDGGFGQWTSRHSRSRRRKRNESEFTRYRSSERVLQSQHETKTGQLLHGLHLVGQECQGLVTGSSTRRKRSREHQGEMNNNLGGNARQAAWYLGLRRVGRQAGDGRGRCVEGNGLSDAHARWSRNNFSGRRSLVALASLLPEDIERLLTERNPSASTTAVCSAVVFLLSDSDRMSDNLCWPQEFEKVARPANDFLQKLYESSGRRATPAKARVLRSVLQRQDLSPMSIEKRGDRTVASLCAWTLDELRGCEDFAEWSNTVLTSWHDMLLFASSEHGLKKTQRPGSELLPVHKSLHTLSDGRGSFVLTLFEKIDGSGMLIRAFDRGNQRTFWLRISRKQMGSLGENASTTPANLVATLARRLKLKVDCTTGVRHLVLPSLRSGDRSRARSDIPTSKRLRPPKHIKERVKETPRHLRKGGVDGDTSCEQEQWEPTAIPPKMSGSLKKGGASYPPPVRGSEADEFEPLPEHGEDRDNEHILSRKNTMGLSTNGAQHNDLECSASGSAHGMKGLHTDAEVVGASASCSAVQQVAYGCHDRESLHDTPVSDEVVDVRYHIDAATGDREPSELSGEMVYGHKGSTHADGAPRDSKTCDDWQTCRTSLSENTTGPGGNSREHQLRGALREATGNTKSMAMTDYPGEGVQESKTTESIPTAHLAGERTVSACVTESAEPRLNTDNGMISDLTGLEFLPREAPAPARVDPENTRKVRDQPHSDAVIESAQSMATLGRVDDLTASNEDPRMAKDNMLISQEDALGKAVVHDSERTGFEDEGAGSKRTDSDEEYGSDFAEENEVIQDNADTDGEILRNTLQEGDNITIKEVKSQLDNVRTSTDYADIPGRDVTNDVERHGVEYSETVLQQSTAFSSQTQLDGDEEYESEFVEDDNQEGAVGEDKLCVPQPSTLMQCEHPSIAAITSEVAGGPTCKDKIQDHDEYVGDDEFKDRVRGLVQSDEEKLMAADLSTGLSSGGSAPRHSASEGEIRRNIEAFDPDDSDGYEFEDEFGDDASEAEISYERHQSDDNLVPSSSVGEISTGIKPLGEESPGGGPLSVEYSRGNLSRQGTSIEDSPDGDDSGSDSLKMHPLEEDPRSEGHPRGEFPVQRISTGKTPDEDPIESDFPEWDFPEGGSLDRDFPEVNSLDRDSVEGDTPEEESLEGDSPEGDSPEKGSSGRDSPEQGNLGKDSPEGDRSESDYPKRGSLGEDSSVENSPTRNSSDRSPQNEESPEGDPPTRDSPKSGSREGDSRELGSPDRVSLGNDSLDRSSSDRGIPGGESREGGSIESSSPEKDSRNKVSSRGENPEGDYPIKDSPEGDPLEGGSPEGNAYCLDIHRSIHCIDTRPEGLRDDYGDGTFSADESKLAEKEDASLLSVGTVRDSLQIRDRDEIGHEVYGMATQTAMSDDQSSCDVPDVLERAMFGQKMGTDVGHADHVLIADSRAEDHSGQNGEETSFGEELLEDRGNDVSSEQSISLEDLHTSDSGAVHGFEGDCDEAIGNTYDQGAKVMRSDPSDQLEARRPSGAPVSRRECQLLDDSEDATETKGSIDSTESYDDSEDITEENAVTSVGGVGYDSHSLSSARAEEADHLDGFSEADQDNHHSEGSVSYQEDVDRQGIAKSSSLSAKEVLEGNQTEKKAQQFSKEAVRRADVAGNVENDSDDVFEDDFEDDFEEDV